MLVVFWEMNGIEGKLYNWLMKRIKSKWGKSYHCIVQLLSYPFIQS